MCPYSSNFCYQTLFILDTINGFRYLLIMRTQQAKYITDEKGHKKAVILDIKYYEKLLHALEEIEDKKAFASVTKEKSIQYSDIETRLKKDNLL